MSLEESEKKLIEQERIFKIEFKQLQDDIKRMQDSYDAPQKEKKSFIEDLEDNFKKDAKDLEKSQAEDIVNKLVVLEGGVKQAIKKIDKEIEAIAGFSSKVSNRWDADKGIEYLKSLLIEFEVLKLRFNQIDKKRDALISKPL